MATKVDHFRSHASNQYLSLSAVSVTSLFVTAVVFCSMLLFSFADYHNYQDPLINAPALGACDLP